MKWLFFFFALSSLASAQQGDGVPLMTPLEEEIVDAQSVEFNRALETVLGDAAKSTVKIWGVRGRRSAGMLAYGTVVGDGTQVLTKWSEVRGSLPSLQVIKDERTAFDATVAGVFTEEDLVLLDLGEGNTIDENNNIKVIPGKLEPVKFYESDLGLGRFLVAPQPSGKSTAFGVVSVLERNLRATDQAHIGVGLDERYRGKGVRILSVQPEYGAAEAGLVPGDVILKIDERTISGFQELKNTLSDKQPGDVVKMLISTAGKEREVEVLLSNRPVSGQFTIDKLNKMERMGGEPNQVRSGFSYVVQSDMQIQSNKMGGPVVDLNGRVVGITMARADRTRTYLMGSRRVLDLLKGEFDSVDEAIAKNEVWKEQLAKQQQALIPRMRSLGKRKSAERMRHQLDDLMRLNELMELELQELGGR
ncbi:PDZ domain-containing protein [Luteolibacter algae]|uniref:PDZ domain-containing protein n=1 Tax=Luteolibacter algae TaxID=454151 RepID=A0ABW5D6R1_9BACT